MICTPCAPAPSAKVKFPRSVAMAAAAELCAALRGCTARLVVAGSLRRGKQEVGDVEILYVPRTEVRRDPADLFRDITVNLVDEALAGLLQAGVIARRTNALGSEIWGEKNKLARHQATQVPVDFFSTTEAAWWNYLVCRTGSAETNMRIASAAQARGWKWHPYRAGFTDQRGDLVPVYSERDVFLAVGLPYLEPQNR